MLQECKICGSKSGVQDNELCALCQRNLMDYMSNQMGMVRQYQQEANQIADPVELKSHYEAMLTIYNEVKSRYLDKSVDPLWIYTGGADTLRSRISKCQARIDEYKSMIQAPIHSDQSGSGQVFCKYCGKPIDADSTFCKFCGRDLSAVQRQPEPAAVKPEPVRTPISQPSVPEPVREIPQTASFRESDPPQKKSHAGLWVALVLIGSLVALLISMGGEPPATVPTDNQTAQAQTENKPAKDPDPPFFRSASSNSEHMIKEKLAHPETAKFTHDPKRFKVNSARMFTYGTVSYTSSSGEVVEEYYNCCLMSDGESYYKLYIQLGDNILVDDRSIVNDLGIVTKEGQSRYSNLTQGSCISDKPLIADWDQEAVRITYDEYQKIEEGMTYDQITQIIGSYGTELSRVDMAGYETVVMAWDGVGDVGANANITVQNGRVTMKAQFGLK